jgi:hypothetical protein
VNAKLEGELAARAAAALLQGKTKSQTLKSLAANALNELTLLPTKRYAPLVAAEYDTDERTKKIEQALKARKEKRAEASKRVAEFDRYCAENKVLWRTANGTIGNVSQRILALEFAEVIYPDENKKMVDVGNIALLVSLSPPYMLGMRPDPFKARHPAFDRWGRLNSLLFWGSEAQEKEFQALINQGDLIGIHKLLDKKVRGEELNSDTAL